MPHPSPCLASIADLANLRAAWRTVRRNRGGAGLDGITLQAFQADLETHLHSIRQAVLARTYTPSALRRVQLTKRGKRRRHIGVPTVADRVLQHAILNVLRPHLEPTFCPCSYGFRPGHSAHQAVLAVADYLGAGLWWVVEADIENFFDTLDRPLLRRALAAHVPDRHTLELIERFLQADGYQSHTLTPPVQGVPQGVGFSPLLANAYLTGFDRSVTSQGYRLVRYGDDFLTLHRTRGEAVATMRMIREMLEDGLRLRLKQEKTHLINARRQPVDFLSFRFRRGSFAPTPHAIGRFQGRGTAARDSPSRRYRRPPGVWSVRGIRSYFASNRCA
jgi:RNA-directed DNA polymerase